MSEQDFIREEHRRRCEAENQMLDPTFERPEPDLFENEIDGDESEDVDCVGGELHQYYYCYEDQSDFQNTGFHQQQSKYNQPAALFHSWEEEERSYWQQHYESDPNFYDFASPSSTGSLGFPPNMLEVEILED